LTIFAIVPVKRLENGKSRLATLLSSTERIKLCELLLKDTLSTLKKTSRISEVIVVSSDVQAEKIAKRYDAKFLKEDKDSGVNEAVAFADDYCSEARATATLVIPQDLPLLLPEDIDSICESAEGYEKCLVICPSLRYDGSNALLRKPSLLLQTHYENNSYQTHIKLARDIGANVNVILSRRIMTDLDTVEDVQNLIKESSIHKAVMYLRSMVR
jgi:2-phospho-L-lactate/phosphoenolpyruvate guanylyltransferase